MLEEVRPSVAQDEVVAVRRRSRTRPALRFALRWVLGPIVTVLTSSLVIFGGMSIAPGDPVTELVGPHASAATRQAVRHALGLDQPFFVQYWRWLDHCLHGNFGQSIVYRGESVTSLLTPRIGNTVFLVLYAAVIIFVFGLALGALGSIRGTMGPIVAAVTSLGVAIPSFVAAAVLVTIFSLKLNWFPAVGSGSGFFDRLHHLTLPAIALAMAWTAYVAQISRAALTEERGREHVETAQGRGLKRSQVFRRHVARNAALPIVTISGLTLAGLIAGAVVVESAFGLSGIGSLLVSSIEGKDYSVVEAISLILVVAFIVMTTLIDAMHVLLDPRLRDRRSR